MMPVEVNYIAILVAAIAAMAVGFIWYGPLFGQKWMKLVGLKIENVKKEEMSKTYAFTFVLALVTAYVMTHILSYVGATTPMAAVQTAFWTWLGFTMPPIVANGLFLGKKPELMAIDAGHFLAAMAVQGVVLTMMM